VNVVAVNSYVVSFVPKSLRTGFVTSFVLSLSQLNSIELIFDKEAYQFVPH
jgi:hypothetical protein